MSALILVDCAISSTRMYLVLGKTAETDTPVCTMEVGEMDGLIEAHEDPRSSQSLLEAFVANVRKALRLLEECFERKTDVAPAPTRVSVAGSEGSGAAESAATVTEVAGGTPVEGGGAVSDSAVSRLRAVVFGLTSWWLDLGGDARAAVHDQLLVELRRTAQEITGVPCRMEPLSRNAEALFEREAVVYAARHALKLDHVDFVVSAGQTSVQYIPSEKYSATPASVVLKLSDGKQTLTNSHFRKRGVEEWEAECLVQISPVVGPYHQRLACETDGTQQFVVIAIGSFFYGAKAIGLAGSSGAAPAKECLLSDVLQSIHDFLEKVDLEKNANDAANLIRMKTGFDRLFPEDFQDRVRIFFARDWQIRGEPFRTTWTSGYFIKHAAMEGPGIHFHELLTSQSILKEWEEFNPSTLLYEDSHRVLRFEDAEDRKMHEMTYSARMRLKIVSPLRPYIGLSYIDHLRWICLRLGRHRMGLAAEGYHMGVEVTLPQSDSASRFVVVAFVGAASSGSVEDDQTCPCPALGFSPVEKEALPVVDLGITFDARRKHVVLQRGTVNLKTFLGTRQTPWDPKTSASYQIWVEKQRGTTWLCFAQDKVLQQRFAVGSAGESPRLSLPAAVQVWVATVGAGSRSPKSLLARSSVGEDAGSPLSAQSRAASQWHKDGMSTVSTEAACTPGWAALDVKMLKTIPSSYQSVTWGAGRFLRRRRDVADRVKRGLYARLPHWVAQSFRPHHDGEEGVRRLSAWPPPNLLATRHSRCSTGSTSSNASSYSSGGSSSSSSTVPCEDELSFVATAGEGDVWMFRNSGESLYNCRPTRSSGRALRVWSVAILDAAWAPCESSSARLRSGAVKVRLLVACGGDDEDPGMASGEDCAVLREYRIVTAQGRHPVSEQVISWPSDTEGKGGHTERVTGIFVSHNTDPRFVYTVSYDTTVIQWSESGELKHRARGFHNEKIYHGALSADGRWLATAAFDHVGIFRTDPRRGLICAALVDHDWHNVGMQWRWFAVEFVPDSIVTEGDTEEPRARSRKHSAAELDEDAQDPMELAPELNATPSTMKLYNAELPRALILGDQDGHVWLVCFYAGEQQRLRLGPVVHFVNISTNGIEIAKHRDCVRQFCWLHTTAASPPARRTLSTFLEPKLMGRTFSVLANFSFSETVRPISFPALCTTSSDRSVRLYDADDIRAIIMEAIAACRSKNPSMVKFSDGDYRSLRTNHSRYDFDIQGTLGETELTPALELVWHSGPVRAAGGDAMGRLYTGSRVIAMWSGLLEQQKGARIHVPTLVIQEADVWDVTIYWCTIVVSALQLLYFTCNRGVLRSGEPQTVVSPIAVPSRLMVVDDAYISPIWLSITTWPLIKQVVFFTLTLLIFVCPSLLKRYYVAKKRLESDSDEDSDRRGPWRTKLACFLAIYIIFGVSLLPTFRAFSELLVCPEDSDGERRMHKKAGETDVVCYKGIHIVLVILCWLTGIFYLCCGLLMESINFKLDYLLEAKVKGDDVFPPRDLGVNGSQAKNICPRDVNALRLLYVAVLELVPNVALEVPEENLGVFTKNPSKHSLRIRFLVKVLCVFVDKLEGFGERANRVQMTLFAILALANLVVHVCYPPLVDPRVGGLILAIQSGIFLGSAVSAVAVQDIIPGLDGVAYAAAYLVVVLGPTVWYLLWRPECCSRCLCCRQRRFRTAPAPSCSASPPSATPPGAGGSEKEPLVLVHRWQKDDGDGTSLRDAASPGEQVAPPSAKLSLLEMENE